MSTSDTASAAPSAAAAQPPTNRPTIVLFGDSLTQLGFGEPPRPPINVNNDDTTPTPSCGWASLLSAMYSRRADVLSRGFSGYNTRHALQVLPRVLATCSTDSKTSNSEQVLFWTVWFGANDAALPNMRQHVPKEEYVENVRRIVDMIRQRSTSPIILMTPPPVFQPKWDQWCRENDRNKSQRTNEASRQYGLALQSLGNELNCEVVNVWKAIGGNTHDYGECLTDGLHLNTKGNQKVFEALMAKIQEKLPALMPMMEGEGRYGAVGIPLEEKLWTELC